MTYQAPKHRIARSGGLLALAALALAAACDFASNRAATGPSNPLAPAAGTESADVAPTPSPDPAETPEAGTADVYIASIEASEPGELVIMDGDDEIARFEVSRTTSGSAAGGGGVVSASARRVSVTGAGNPIYFVDGVRVETPVLDALDIHRVEVVKGAAAERIFGPEAADGVIRVTTRAAAAAEGVQTEAVLAPTHRVETTAAGAVGRSIPADANPIYFVDGVRIESVDMETLDIQSIEVIKGAAARRILGEEAVNGVVRITTKGATTLNTPSPTERVRTRAERVQDAVEEAQPMVRQVQQSAIEVEASAVRMRQVSERPQTESRRDSTNRGPGGGAL